MRLSETPQMALINEGLKRIHRTQGWLETMSLDNPYSLARRTAAEQGRLFEVIRSLQETLDRVLRRTGGAE